jgi:hypothetical protein
METQYLLNRMSNEMVDDARYGSAYYIQSDLSHGHGRFKADGLPICCVDQCQMLAVVMSGVWGY